MLTGGMAFAAGWRLFYWGYHRMEVAVYISARRIAVLLALLACVSSTASGIGPADRGAQPSRAAIADSQAVAATHRSRTLAALFEEFRTTTPDNARINSRAISNLFFDGNPLMRLVSSGDFAPIQASSHPITRFEADAIASFKAGGPGFF